MTSNNLERTLVLAPTAADGAITQSILVEAALPSHLCTDSVELCRELRGGAGAILMTEEMLALNDAHELFAELHRQPAWSDIPVLVLCGSRSGSVFSSDISEQLGNVTVLERPVRLINLVSALRTAIRARRRQYQIRDQLTALELAEESLREADRRKDEFLAILAHELRNPLAPVRNAAHFLALQHAHDPSLNEAIEMIGRQTAQMARLIDDLLDVSRISRGLLALRRGRIEFKAIAEAAMSASRHVLDAQHHTLSMSFPVEPVVLDADRDRLIQVLSNLLTNAAKYTATGGQIDFAATVSGSVLEISIKDNGIGLPAGKLTEIFELFAQVDRSFDRQAGLGIGLTLVRQLTTLHGGTVEARSDGIGHGSEFVVRLPIPAVGRAQMPAVPREPVQAGLPLRILLADDNLDGAQILAMVLTVSGHDVRVAHDGEAAIELAEEFMPDVALLDIGMPKMNGYETATHLRGQALTSGVFLVALTGWGQESDRRRAREAGFDAYLVKPADPEELTKLLAGRQAVRAV